MQKGGRVGGKVQKGEEWEEEECKNGEEWEGEEWEEGRRKNVRSGPHFRDN